jgi:hypothetical protein
MALSRYSRTEIITNDNDMYDETFKNKGVRRIRQYETSVVYYPSDENMLQVKYDTRRWKLGDKLYKIAYEAYGDSRYWWVISQFNQKPTPSHFKIGDIYYVPLSLEQVLDYFRI